MQGKRPYQDSAAYLLQPKFGRKPRDSQDNQATLGTKERGRCSEVTVGERFNKESMYGLSAKKVAVVERRPFVEV